MTFDACAVVVVATCQPDGTFAGNLAPNAKLLFCGSLLS